MSDEPRKSAKTLEPGTIDRTRRNIGSIDRSEADAIAKKLGGEVLHERSVITSSSMPSKKRTVVSSSVKASGLSSADIAAKSAALSATSNLSNKPSTTVSQLKTDFLNCQHENLNLLTS